MFGEDQTCSWDSDSLILPIAGLDKVLKLMGGRSRGRFAEAACSSRFEEPRLSFQIDVTWNMLAMPGHKEKYVVAIMEDGYTNGVSF